MDQEGSIYLGQFFVFIEWNLQKSKLATHLLLFSNKGW